MRRWQVAGVDEIGHERRHGVHQPLHPLQMDAAHREVEEAEETGNEEREQADSDDEYVLAIVHEVVLGRSGGRMAAMVWQLQGARLAIELPYHDQHTNQYKVPHTERCLMHIQDEDEDEDMSVP